MWQSPGIINVFQKKVDAGMKPSASSTKPQEGKESHSSDFVLLTSLPPRPGSALVRPGTAKTYAVRNEEENISNAVIQQQVHSDSLLRIFEDKDSTVANEAILFAESGDFKSIRILLERGEDLVSVKGMGGYR